MTNENKFFALSVIVVLLVGGVISYSYLKPRNSYPVKQPITNINKANTDSSNNANTPKKYSLLDVAKHNIQTDCWQAIDGKVYNLTSVIDVHPGGAQAVIQFCGQDATVGFNDRNGNGPHPNGANEDLANFYIGDLK